MTPAACSLRPDCFCNCLYCCYYRKSRTSGRSFFVVGNKLISVRISKQSLTDQNRAVDRCLQLQTPEFRPYFGSSLTVMQENWRKSGWKENNDSQSNRAVFLIACNEAAFKGKMVQLVTYLVERTACFQGISPEGRFLEFSHTSSLRCCAGWDVRFGGWIYCKRAGEAEDFAEHQRGDEVCVAAFTAVI